MAKGSNNKFLLALLFLGGIATILFKSKKKDKLVGRVIPYDDFGKDDISNYLKDFNVPNLEEGAGMPELAYENPQPAPPPISDEIDGQVISLNITNNTNSDMSLISILGNNQDFMDNSNATTQYGWDLTGFSVTTESNITIEYKGVNEVNFTTTTISFVGTTLQSIADALNTLNLGTFFIATSGGNTYLYNYNQNIVFGSLQITSPSIINTFFVVSSGFNNLVYATKLQSDGKILVGGNFTTYQGVTKNRIVRLNTDGSIDTSFVIGSGFSTTSVYGIQVQSDGKIIVVGLFTSYNGTGANNIIRLNSDGSVDGTFVYGTGFGGGGSPFNSVIQSDGKIIVFGSFGSYNGTGANYIIRLNTNGSVDGTFVYGSGFINNLVNDVALQSDGKLVVVGDFISYNGTLANNIIRLNTNGSVDGTFVYGTGLSGGNGNCVAIQSDGKILVGGQFTSYNGTGANRIIRLNTNGSVDGTFVYGSGFSVASNEVYRIAIQTDGKIVVGGNFTIYNGTNANFIIRLNSGGSVDTTWDYGSGFDSWVYSIALSTYKMYLGGNFTTFQSISYPRIISLNQ